MMKIIFTLCLVLVMNLSTTAQAKELAVYLTQGSIAEGLEAFESPDNDAERFSLAMLQVFAGVEKFSQDFNNLGLRPDSPLGSLPFIRLAVLSSTRRPTEPATPETTAGIFQALRQSFRDANHTLSKIDGDDFGVEVNLTQVHLDFDGSGTIEETESLMQSLGDLMGGLSGDPAAGDLVIRFDRSDAVWLLGYTHFLSGFMDILLAYDWRPVWDQCAHVLLLNPDPRPPFNEFAGRDASFPGWVDLMAALHDMRLELTDSKAWPRAREEFQGMISSSRICWEYVLAETDNQQEWLPSPSQTGPGDSVITQDQIDGWMLVLDELDAISRGEKLLPHWRVRPGMGINLDKLVDAPPELDMVLWIHGSAMIPFLEEGPVSDDATWQNLTAPFGPEFTRFALWSN